MSFGLRSESKSRYAQNKRLFSQTRNSCIILRLIPLQLRAQFRIHWVKSALPYHDINPAAARITPNDPQTIKLTMYVLLTHIKYLEDLVALHRLQENPQAMKKPHARTGDPLSGKASPRLPNPELKFADFWLTAFGRFLTYKVAPFLVLSETNFIAFK